MDRVSLEDYKEKIWLWHPEESEEAYRWFIVYYLETNSTSLLGSYKQYLQKERHYSEEKALKVQGVAKKYKNWASGCDIDGNLIEGLNTFEERLKAYQEYILTDKLENIKIKRNNILSKEFGDGQKLEELWEDIFSGFEEQYNYYKAEAKSKKEVYNSAKDIGKLKELVMIRKDIAILLRNSVGMTSQVKEDVYADALNEKKNNKPNIEWVELPAAADKFDDEVDKLSDDEFESLLKNSEDLYNYLD